MGRNDRRRGLNIMIVFEHPVIGDALLEATPTRRDTASAEPIPAGIPLTASRGTAAHILGHPSAYRSIAISTRAHHCGGAPIHDVPARRNPNQHAPPRPPRHPCATRQTSAPRLVNDLLPGERLTARATNTPTTGT